MWSDKFLDWARTTMGFVELPVLKEMPAHVRDLNVDGLRVFLHMDGTDRKNPDVDASPWISAGKKKGRRR